MKAVVVSDTRDRLLVKLPPRVTLWLAYAGFGLLFIAAGVLVIFALGRSVEFTIKEGRISYADRSALGIVGSQFEISTADVASVELGMEETELRKRFDIVFTTRGPDGGRQLRTISPTLTKDDKLALIEEIKAVIGTPGGQLDASENNYVAGWAFGGLCIVGGVICLHALQSITIEGTRTGESGVLRIAKRRLLVPLSSSVEEVELDQIRQFRTKVWSGGGDFDGAQSADSYNIFIDRKKGKPLPLAYMAVFKERDASRLIEVLEGWLEQ